MRLGDNCKSNVFFYLIYTQQFFFAFLLGLKTPFDRIVIHHISTNSKNAFCVSIQSIVRMTKHAYPKFPLCGVVSGKQKVSSDWKVYGKKITICGPLLQKLVVSRVFQK